MTSSTNQDERDMTSSTNQDDQDKTSTNKHIFWIIAKETTKRVVRLRYKYQLMNSSLTRYLKDKSPLYTRVWIVKF